MVLPSKSEGTMLGRRELIKFISLAPLLANSRSFGPAKAQTSTNIWRKIPMAEESIPAIGMGSYQTFNVAEDSEKKRNLLNVLKAFFDGGGSLIDSSPMYGRSESVLGELLSQLESVDRVFAASKVWTYGEQHGIAAVEESMRRMQTPRMDLMQVHNLRDWKTHLKTLRRMKEEGQVRYIGITTSRISQYQDFEKVMLKEPLDFIQVNYNIKVREAEKRILPLARDKNIAVIINMPFEKGRLFKLVKNQTLPEWAKEFDCNTWGQFFLKFIIANPVVTCAIPATSKIDHMRDNMQAMKGRLPSVAMRERMLQHFADR